MTALLFALLLPAPAGPAAWPEEGERVAAVRVDAPAGEAERLQSGRAL